MTEVATGQAFKGGFTFGFMVCGGALFAALLFCTALLVGVSQSNANFALSSADEYFPPVTVMDEAVQLAEQHYQAFPYDYQSSTRALNGQLSLEVTWVGGTPLDTFVMDRTNFLRFQAGSDFSYLAAVSQQSLQGQFVSPWFQPKEDGTFYVVVRPTNVRDGNWSEAAARVVLKARV